MDVGDCLLIIGKKVLFQPLEALFPSSSSYPARPLGDGRLIVREVYVVQAGGRLGVSDDDFMAALL